MKKVILISILLLLSVGVYLLGQAVAPTEVTYTALAGQRVVLNASAEGTTPMTFNWYKDGTFIGVTNTITLTSVQTSNAGVYKVTAINSVGQSESEPTRLIVIVPIAPNKVKITVTITNN